MSLLQAEGAHRLLPIHPPHWFSCLLAALITLKSRAPVGGARDVMWPPSHIPSQNKTLTLCRVSFRAKGAGPRIYPGDNLRLEAEWLSSFVKSAFVWWIKRCNRVIAQQGFKCQPRKGSAPLARGPCVHEGIESVGSTVDNDHRAYSLRVTRIHVTKGPLSYFLHFIYFPPFE